jgi:hypothetical protein
MVDSETCKVIPRRRKGKVLTPAQFGCLQGISTLNPELLDLYSKNTGYALFHYQAILDSLLQDYPVKTFFGNRMFPTNRSKKNRR